MKANTNTSTTINKSVIRHLQDQNLINDSLLVLINNLTIEDLVAIKLELSAIHLKNRLYGFDIWKNSSRIMKDALLKFAISTTNSKKDAARFLGMTYGDFKKALKRYKVDNYFEEKDNELESL